jgi:hypothetical protein
MLNRPSQHQKEQLAPKHRHEYQIITPINSIARTHLNGLVRRIKAVPSIEAPVWLRYLFVTILSAPLPGWFETGMVSPLQD